MFAAGSRQGVGPDVAEEELLAIVVGEDEVAPILQPG